MSKKVLIMSASTGGGHNRAAKAMKEEIEKDVLMVNILLVKL